MSPFTDQCVRDLTTRRRRRRSLRLNTQRATPVELFRQRRQDGVVSASVFISYRRSETAELARRLQGHLEKTLAVWMNVYDIRPDGDRTAVIPKTLEPCDAIVVLIGPRWLESNGDQDGLDKPNDYVRLEIEYALEHQKILIPIPAEGIEMPSADKLPDSLRPLVAIEPFAVRETTFAADASRLDQLIKKRIEERDRKESSVGIVWLLVAIALLLFLWRVASVEPPPPTPEQTGPPYTIAITNLCSRSVSVLIRYHNGSEWTFYRQNVAPGGPRPLTKGGRTLQTNKPKAFYYARNSDIGQAWAFWHRGRSYPMLRARFRPSSGAIPIRLTCS